MSFLILFDLDGTLINSKADIANAVNFSLAAEGFPTLPKATIESFVGHGLMNLIEDVLGKPTPEEAKRVAQQFKIYYDAHLLDETTLYPGVREFLESKAHHPMGVVTNKPYGFSKKILEGLKIDHYFKWLIGGDSLPVQKPSPKMLDPIFESFPFSADTLLVGDSQIDVDCGKAAGIRTCGVTYGYRDRSELIAAQPDFIIDAFPQLQELPIFL
ncbi:MAG: HAD-IA family hydrolase [Deltaproteobacteria bacterium]|nr:HAD-IA family hydrolase [Deltaproteobacteria bacterium]